MTGNRAAAKGIDDVGSEVQRKVIGSLFGRQIFMSEMDTQPRPDLQRRHGPLIGPASYFMKSPPQQFTDQEARERTIRFINGD